MRCSVRIRASTFALEEWTQPEYSGVWSDGLFYAHTITHGNGYGDLV